MMDDSPLSIPNAICSRYQDSVVCVAFNHDGSMVATGDMAGMIKVSDRK